MQRYLTTRNVHFVTAIFLTIAPLVPFFVINPPNATLLTGVFYGIIFLLSFSIWQARYKWSTYLIFFLYLSLLVGLFGPVRWAFFTSEWLGFGILLLSYLLVLANIWMQGQDLRNEFKKRQPIALEEEE